MGTHVLLNLSLQDMFEEKRNIVEPAGALALAGAEAYCKYYGLRGENIVVITSGANMNFDKLRVVTELANVGRRQEAVLATLLPEVPGSFKRFCELVPCSFTQLLSQTIAVIIMVIVGNVIFDDRLDP